MARLTSVTHRLLDHQVVDGDGLPLGRVDDLEITVGRAGEPPAVTALLIGQQALGGRLGGQTGALLAGSAARLRGAAEPAGPTRVATGLVTATQPLVRLTVPLAELPGVAGLERWLAEHVVSRLTGVRRAG
jgi:hypothetical protein